jgi:soluble lytic murein transglycosylase
MAAGAVVLGGVTLGAGDGLSGRLYPLHYRDEIAAAADKYGVDPYLVAAVTRAESNFRPAAVSRAGAIGLMQLMPETADWITRQEDWEGSAEPELTDPAQNVQLGTYYLAYLMGRFGGEVATALAAYNAGHGEVERWLAAASPRSTALSLEEIPFSETRDFVKRVERFRAVFREIHPDAFS